MKTAWRVLAGVGGASAVALGAYGAHGFKPKDPYFIDVFDRANKYHFLHSILLAMSPLGRWVSGLCSVLASLIRLELLEDTI